MSKGSNVNLAARNLATDARYRPQTVKARKGKGSYSRKGRKGSEG